MTFVGFGCSHLLDVGGELRGDSIVQGVGSAPAPSHDLDDGPRGDAEDEEHDTERGPEEPSAEFHDEDTEEVVPPESEPEASPPERDLASSEDGSPIN